MNGKKGRHVLRPLADQPDLFRDIPIVVSGLLQDHGIVTCEQALVFIRWLQQEDQWTLRDELELEEEDLALVAQRLTRAIHPLMASRLADDEGRRWIEQRPLGVLPPPKSPIDRAVEAVRRRANGEPEAEEAPEGEESGPEKGGDHDRD